MHAGLTENTKLSYRVISSSSGLLHDSSTNGTSMSLRRELIGKFLAQIGLLCCDTKTGQCLALIVCYMCSTAGNCFALIGAYMRHCKLVLCSNRLLGAAPQDCCLPSFLNLPCVIHAVQQARRCKSLGEQQTPRLRIAFRNLPKLSWLSNPLRSR